MKKHHYHLRHRTHPLGPLLSFIDGLEGGFAIFAGIVAGLSFTNIDRRTLIVTALIGITVNAVNAATIRYSTEHYYDELDGHEKLFRPLNNRIPYLYGRELSIPYPITVYRSPCICCRNDDYHLSTRSDTVRDHTRMDIAHP